MEVPELFMVGLNAQDMVLLHHVILRQFMKQYQVDLTMDFQVFGDQNRDFLEQLGQVVIRILVPMKISFILLYYIQYLIPMIYGVLLNFLTQILSDLFNLLPRLMFVRMLFSLCHLCFYYFKILVNLVNFFGIRLICQ